jgi:zinc protease
VLLPDSLITRRFPIGTEEVIKNAPRERFVDFYTRYYTPQRMTFIVVGDVDAGEMRGRIEAAFASMGNPGGAGPDPDLGGIPSRKGLKPPCFMTRRWLHRCLADAGAAASAKTGHPCHPRRTHAARHRALDLTRRFERFPRSANSRWLRAPPPTRPLQPLEFGSISITAADDRWQEVVPVLEQEFRRALERLH